MKTKPIPDRVTGAIPYLYYRNATGALEFYQKAFGATETAPRFSMPNGKVGHAEIKISNALIMLADEFPDHGVRSPESVGGTPMTVLIYVEDVDALAKRAVAAGAKIVMPVTDQFYGDRNCKLLDPFGHSWMFSTHKEDVSEEEMQKRAVAMFNKK